MKYMIIGDQHVADRAPSSRKDTYRQDILDKLAWIIEEANRQEVDAVLNLGDVLHVKRADRNSHGLIQELARIFGTSNAPVIVCPGNHDMCVSQDSEALTDQGWKLLEDLNGTEKFATLNPDTHRFEWQVPTKITRSFRTGTMLHFKTQTVDHLVTPNHDMYINKGTHKKDLSRGWVKEKADKAPTYQRWRVLTAAKSIENIGLTKIGVSSGSSSEMSLPAKDALALFGWYLSEGSIERGGSTVSIAKRKTSYPEYYAEIESLVKRLGFEGTYEPDRIRIKNRDLAAFLEGSFGNGSLNKRLPSWIYEASEDEASCFLLAYLSGDGHLRKLGKGTTSYIAGTVSKQLRDDLHTFGSVFGWTVRQRKPVEPNSASYAVSTYYPMTITKINTAFLYGYEEVEYSGEVWCPTLDNGIWMVRRNGKSLWTGNSMDRLDSIPSQPLGTLGLHPNVEILMGASDDLPVYSVPYVDPTEENLRFWTDKYRSEGGPDTYPFIITHQAIFPKKEEPIYPWVSAEDWASEFGAKYTAYGHIHSRMKAGPFYDIGGTTFCNNGAISRGSLHEETINRKLAVTLFDDSEQVGKKAFTSIPIPYKPAAEVFDLEAVAISKGNEAKIDAFLGSLKSSELKHLTIETVLDSARSNPNLGKEAVLELEDIVTQVMTN